MFRRLWEGYAQAYRVYIFAAFPCALLAGAAGAAQVYLFQPAIDNALIAGDSTALWLLPLAFLLASIFRGGAAYVQTVLITYAVEKMVVGLQKDIFSRLLRLDLAFFHKHGESLQVGRFLTDVRFIREGAARFFTSLPKELLTALGMLCVILYHSPQLSLVLFVFAPMSIYPIVIIGRKIRHIAYRTQDEAGRMTSVLDQSFAALRQIKIAGRYEEETARAGFIFGKMQKLMVKMVCYDHLLGPVNELMKAVCFGFAIVFGGYLVQQGEMTVGAFASFMIALVGFFGPFRVLSRINSVVQAGLAGMQRTFELLDREPKIVDAPNAQTFAYDQGEVVLRDLYFAYDDRLPVLNGLNLHIKGGDHCALVGSSGAGKSTVLSLILRLMEPHSGQVLIDHQDVSAVTQESLHRQIAYISQEVELLNISLRENLRYAAPEASDEEIFVVLKQVGLEEFVKDLPEGLDAQIGEHGVRLSGGQRQRVAFARALMKKAPILLMDEATSALDSESEQHIQRALEELDCQTTVIIVAHRLSTVRRADQICVLDQGRVIEQGTHDGLLAEKGAYYRFFSQQWPEDGVREVR